ncbi:hypothetical protein [Flavobacterium psychrotolerans]|nr:hypothetical protein [Flavobacterium psychrotolerans]
MRKSASIVLLLYFLLGIFFLPMGDFSVLKDIPDMYRNCKENEDKDMTFVDFITDHLVDMDAIFDKHDKGDEQKPHKYTYHNHSIVQVNCKAEKIEFKNTNLIFSIKKESGYHAPLFCSTYISSILKPPILA